MEEVSLRIEDSVFKVNKGLLCEHSDYFRAMFSGYYIESKKEEVFINMLDANIMSIIIKYMQDGIILFNEHTITTIGEIALTSNYLQITELTKQLQVELYVLLCEVNWIETMTIAQNASYTELEQYSVAYGLYSFNSMKPDNIPTIQQLLWYLAHPYLDSRNELYVFKFGLKWLFRNQQLDRIILILACLDMKRIAKKNLNEIKDFLSDYMSHFSNFLFLDIIKCLLYLIGKNVDISRSNLNEHKTELCENFTENVWTESLCMVENSRPRLLRYVPVVPLWVLRNQKLELLPHFLYTFKEDKGFEQYLEVAEKNLWGWNVTAWGLTKLVVVCGEFARGTGVFKKDVKVYDTLKKKWTQYDVQLPSRRHAGITTVGDLLYIVGGVGEYRVVLETAIVFDLKRKSFRQIANLPEAIQGPAVCTHNNKVYMAGHKNIYVYETYDDKDFWELSAITDRRMTFLRSCNNYIYCMQSYFRMLYRFRPGVDNVLQPISPSSSLPGAICTLGASLMIFTRTETDAVAVEEYSGEDEYDQLRVLPIEIENMRVNDVSGSCSVVLTLPPLCPELPPYIVKHLEKYPIV